METLLTFDDQLENLFPPYITVVHRAFTEHPVYSKIGLVCSTKVPTYAMHK